MKRIWLWFCALSRFRQILLIVVCFHGTGIFFLLADHCMQKRTSPHRPMAIRQICISNSVQKATCSASQPLQQGKSKSSSVRVVAKEAVKQQTVPKNNNCKKEAVHHAEEELFCALAKGLEELGTKKGVSTAAKTAISIPLALNMVNKQSDAGEQGTYRDAVLDVLQSQLDLPELGKVVVHMALDPAGKIVLLEIVDACSEKNSAFLKKRLQELSFPCFNEFALDEKTVDFTITFRNVETDNH